MRLKICPVCYQDFEVETYDRVCCTPTCNTRKWHFRKYSQQDPNFRLPEQPDFIVKYEATVKYLERYARYVELGQTAGLAIKWINKIIPMPEWENKFNIIIERPDHNTLIMYHPADYEYHLFKVQAQTEPQPTQSVTPTKRYITSWEQIPTEEPTHRLDDNNTT